jgi:predicted nuclease of predicted toxin-antitoxin system
MRFLLDESADFPLAAFLRTLGHDVTTIAHDYPYGLKDADVLAIAHREQRILITNDRDFGELVFRRNQSHAGVILFRLDLETLPIKQQWLRHIVTVYADRLGEFIVITPRGIRVRRSP